MKRARELIQALGARFNGHPKLAYYDLGIYGHWGEWHTDGLCTPPGSLGVQRALLDMQLAAFSRSLVLMNAGADVDTFAQALDLKRYPQPLTISPNLQRLAFVLAPDDPKSWTVAASIAFDLGRQTQGSVADLLAVFGDSVPDQVRSTRDLLIVGRASKLPILDDLKPSLPAPFEAGSDLAAEPNTQVQYRRSRSESVGYVQLLAAHWAEERTILAVLGSTEQGLGPR